MVYSLAPSQRVVQKHAHCLCPQAPNRRKYRLFQVENDILHPT